MSRHETRLRPIELEPIEKHLTALFQDHIPAGEKQGDEATRAWRSLALAALALVHSKAKCSPDHAAAALVDGGGDGGIDAVHFDAAGTVWLVQAKFVSEGTTGPDLGSVSKFVDGVRHFCKGDFDYFKGNQRWLKRTPEMRHRLDMAQQVRAILIYSGTAIVQEDRRRLFKDLEEQYNREGEFLKFETHNLTTIFDWVVGADISAGVEKLSLTLHQPGWVVTGTHETSQPAPSTLPFPAPFPMLYGMLSLQELVALIKEHGEKLIEANLRGFRGDTEVNRQIQTTLQDHPEHFVYLNNGLTAYCLSYSIPRTEITEVNQKRVTTKYFSIVNGAQTVGSIARFHEQNPKRPLNGFVFIRLISLQHCEDERSFAKNLTRTTNLQNQVRREDFVFLDEDQRRIAFQLRACGIDYQYRSGEHAHVPGDHALTLEEATSACACLDPDKECVLVSCLQAAPSELLRQMPQDAVPSELDLYRRVFPLERSGRDVWRAVQAQRTIQAALETVDEPSSLKRSLVRQARWLIQALVFLDEKPARSDKLQVSDREHARFRKKALETAELLWNICETRGAAVAGSPEHASEPSQWHFDQPDFCAALRQAVLKRSAPPSKKHSVPSRMAP